MYIDILAVHPPALRSLSVRVAHPLLYGVFFVAYMLPDQRLKILLNDLDVSSSHMDRLTKDLAGQPVCTQLYLDMEQRAINSAITNLSGATTKFGVMLKVGSLLVMGILANRLTTVGYRTTFQPTDAPKTAHSHLRRL